MVKIRSLSIALASVVAVTSMCLLMGVRDAKAQSMDALLKRIEALESRSVGNVTAPKIRGLKLGFEIRHRFEARDNQDGDRTISGSDFTLQRTRIYLDANVNKNVRGYVKLQDVRTWGAEQNTVGNLARVDLHEGFVELRKLGDFYSLLDNVEVRAGRWQQWYGNHRWFGHLNWANQSRSYDGLRVRYDNKKNVWVDLWAYQVEEKDTGAVSGDIGNGNLNAGAGGGNVGGITTSLVGAKDQVFWGFYSHIKVAEGIAVEPYTAVRQIERLSGASRETRYHMGSRIVGKNIPWLPGVDFTFEQAFQRGRTYAGTGPGRSLSIDAHAGAYEVGYTFKDVAWTPRIGYAYVYATGDGDTADGDNETFSQLYPTGHARLGYIDFHGWQNIRDHQFHLTLKPSKKLLLKADFHDFRADQRLDGWYSVAGNLAGNRGASTGGAFTTDTDYGQEIDLTLKYKLMKNFGVVVGYTHYFTDDFVEDYANRPTGIGSDDQDADWFYLMTTMKF